MAERPPAPVARLDALDGLRGTAALVVVAFHTSNWVLLPQSVQSGWLMSPLGVLVNGPGAVHVFFVLSGFVLALTLARDAGAGGVARYYVRRLFRIQPPYMVAVLFAWVVSIHYPVVGGLMRFNTAGTPCFHIPGRLLPSALVLPSVAYGQLLVGWSLYVELLISMLFPTLLILGQRIHALVPLLLAVVLLELSDPRLHFLRFTFDFALGLAIYLHRDDLARWLERLPRGAWLVWLLLAVALLQAPSALERLHAGEAALKHDHSPPAVVMISPLIEHEHSPAAVVLMSLGSGMLIAAALQRGAVQRMFSMPWARFLGRISYSLYLLHATVLTFALCRVTGRGLSPLEGLALFAVVLAVSMGLAELTWRWVEAPSIRVGRWVNGWIRRRGAAGSS